MIDIMKQILSINRFSLVLVAATSILGLFGCTPLPGPQLTHQQFQPTLGPTRLPEYTVGTTFVYSDGTWDRVAEENPSYVVWENHQGYRSLNSTDFTYRSSKWESKGIKGYRSFTPTEYLYSETSASLWPLAIGNQTHFDEKSKWGVTGIYEKHFDASWKCSVAGTEQVQVPAGVFDTWKLSCSRYSKTTAARSRLWEQKTYNYAPAVGHWVILNQEFTNGKPGLHKELVAILPSLKALGIDKKNTVRIKEHFQQTLGTSPSGQMERWSDPSKKISFSMTPLATYRLADDTPCRQYEQKLDLGWHSKSYYGIACRSESGLWTVPRK